jgi:hypothetical protein
MGSLPHQIAMVSRDDIFDDLQTKLKTLDETLWERKANWPHVEKWLSQFASAARLEDNEQIQMLFLASHFMYFGVREIRALLRSLFRDLYQYKTVERIRRRCKDTRDRAILLTEFRKTLSKTRFLGIGNPSESGSHLLYYFRQENRLGKEYFINADEIFSRAGFGPFFFSRVKDKSVEQYVFIDDLCGSGAQAAAYSKDTVRPLKRMNSAVKVAYYALFATTSGLDAVRKLGWFDDVAAVVELDESFKCFSALSRIYRNEQPHFNKDKAEAVCRKYGARLVPAFPLGWRDGQLLLGFCHNTPDNTLPIIWYDEPEGVSWTPFFRRFPKHYGWESWPNE